MFLIIFWFAAIFQPAEATNAECDVHIESSIISRIITSKRVNYPPYSSQQSIPSRKLVEFGLNDPITDTSNNPCDTSTWTIAPISYDNSIILLQYSQHFSNICSPQKWTFNLQTFNSNISAVLIANTMDDTYILTGDTDSNNEWNDTIIPTRMISYSSYETISNIINNDEDVFVSISCGNNTLCIQDPNPSSISYGAISGEFEKDDTLMNGHYIWVKEEMDGTMSLIWFDSWKWVISRDYSNDSDILWICLSAQSDEMNDPTDCNQNWYNYDTGTLNDLYISSGKCDGNAIFTTQIDDNHIYIYSKTDSDNSISMSTWLIISCAVFGICCLIVIITVVIGQLYVKYPHYESPPNPDSHLPSKSRNTNENNKHKCSLEHSISLDVLKSAFNFKESGYGVGLTVTK